MITKEAVKEITERAILQIVYRETYCYELNRANQRGYNPFLDLYYIGEPYTNHIRYVGSTWHPITNEVVHDVALRAMGRT